MGNGFSFTLFYQALGITFSSTLLGNPKIIKLSVPVQLLKFPNEPIIYTVNTSLLSPDSSFINEPNNNDTYTLKKIDDMSVEGGDIEIYWNRFINIYISVNKFDIEKINEVDFNSNMKEGGGIISNGGYKKSSKFKTKEVLGKLRRVYKIPNSKKEHIMHKGILITLSEYKALMKLKNKK